MIGWILRIVFVVVVAVVTVVATAPLSYVVDGAKSQMPGVHWAQAQGSIWSGRLSNVSYGAQAVGDIELKLKPSGLLSGRMIYDLEVMGPVAAGTATAYVRQGGLGVSELDVSARLEQLIGLNTTVRQAGGIARVTDVTVDLDRSGCQRASGRVWTDTLVNLGAQYGEQLPELVGSFGCDNQMLVLAMDGAENGGITVDIDLRVGLSEPSRLEASIGGASGEIAQALAALGFTVDDGRFVYVRETALMGGGG